MKKNEGIIKNIKLSGCGIKTNDPSATGEMAACIICGINNGTIEQITANNCSINGDIGSLSSNADNTVICGVVCGDNRGILQWICVEQCVVDIYCGYADSAVLGRLSEYDNILSTTTQRDCNCKTNIEKCQGGAVGKTTGCTSAD